MAVMVGALWACGGDGGAGVAGLGDDATHSDALKADDAVADAGADAAAPADVGATAGDATDDGSDVAALDSAPEDAAGRVAPCGNAVGDVMCNADMRGYISDAVTGLASTKPFSEGFSVAEVMATTTPKFAVVLLGAWW